MSVLSHGIGALARLGAALTDVAFPKTCAGCGSRGAWLCSFCHDTATRIGGPACDRCGVSRNAPRDCACSEMGHALERARSAVVYEGWAAMAVRHLKYHGESDRAGHLAQYMQEWLHALGPVHALVPVPLHGSRYHERGYNQAEELALRIGHNRGIPVHPMLVRLHKTASQTTLTREERRKNVDQAFAMADGWKPDPRLRYVLIDDVRTTGSTLDACASVLVKAGARSVCALTFAIDL